MNYSVNLDITPGGMPPVLHMSQYDTDRQYTVNLKDGGSSYSLGTGATGKVKGFNGKACFEIEATASGSTVTFQLTDASTDQFGIFPVTLELTNDGETISPLCMIFDVQRAGYTNEQAANSPEFENAMEEAAQQIIASEGILLTENQAEKTAAMTIPVGVDENGKLWVESGGWSSEAKSALLNLLEKVAYIDEDGQDYYDALVAALGGASVVSISAVYTQTGTVYDTASLDSLKADLVVTAEYSNGTEVAVTDYILSGTLTAGTSTITVTYEGQTDTFDVTVTANPLPSSYKRIEYVERNISSYVGGIIKTGLTLNGTDDVTLRIGVMPISAPISSYGGYFIVCRQTNSANSVGFGVYVPNDVSAIGAFDGQSCMITPSTILNQKHDMTVLKTSSGLGVTDGTLSNSVTGTPRAMASELYLFAMLPYSGGTNYNMPINGRIYYCEVTEGGVEKLHLIPCKRISDNAVGFYDTISESFKTDSKLTAGPEV